MKIKSLPSLQSYNQVNFHMAKFAFLDYDVVFYLKFKKNYDPHFKATSTSMLISERYVFDRGFQSLLVFDILTRDILTKFSGFSVVSAFS